MKLQIYKLILFVPLFFCLSEIRSQPKISIDFGMGFYQPTLDGFDENSFFPSTNALSKNLKLEIDRNEKKYFIEFRDGNAKAPLKVIGKSKT